jgi:hypothetical protein
MQIALPRQNLAVPLITLLLGAAGGAAVTIAVNDDEIIRVPSISQPAENSSSPAPVVDQSLRGSKATSTGAVDTGGGESAPNNFGARP